jgi:beta-glucanase (GH16 family)
MIGLRLMLALALAVSATACGGGAGGSASPPVTSPPPPSPPPPPPAGPGDPAIFEPGGVPAGYRLVWSDEFDADGLPDASKWDYDTDRNALGWYNNEAQYYARDRLENARVENGVLVIEARHEDLDPAVFADWGGQHYTSARLVTRGKAAWTYGFVEARAKLPCGVGTWPAIWTLSAPPQTAWPDDGEIDIMEHVGWDEGVIHGSVHTQAYNHTLNNGRTATVTAADVCGAFHLYQLTWTADRITIGFDDRNYFQYSNDGSGNSEWPFDSPQYLLLNVAVGGTWGGQNGIDDSIFPVRMEIDYVRVYQPS